MVWHAITFIYTKLIIIWEIIALQLCSSLYGMSSAWALLLTNITLLFLANFLLIEVSYEKAENELLRNVIFSLKFRYRPKNNFLVSSLQIDFIHSCLKCASYELHQMEEEDLSLTNMCHLLIIIVIKLWWNIDNSRFRFFFERTVQDIWIKYDRRLSGSTSSNSVWMYTFTQFDNW